MKHAVNAKNTEWTDIQRRRQSHLTAEMNSKSVKVLIAIEVPNHTLFKLLFTTLQRCAAKTDIEKQTNRHLPLTETHVTTQSDVATTSIPILEDPTFWPPRIWVPQNPLFSFWTRLSCPLSFQVLTPPTPLSFWVSYLCLLILSERERGESHLKLKPTQLPTLWSLSLSFWAFHASIPGLCTCVCVCVCECLGYSLFTFL